MTDRIPDVELAGLLIGDTYSIGHDDGDAAAPSATGDSAPSRGRKANPVLTPDRAKIGCVRALTFQLLTICILPGIVAMLLLLVARTRDEQGRRLMGTNEVAANDC